MKNATVIRRRLEEIKEMTDVHQAISALADIQYDIGVSACGERQKLQKEVENLRRLIIGNGDPSQSIVMRLLKVESDVGEVKAKVDEIHTEILGDLEKDKKGLVSRVRDCERVNANLIKVVWIVVGVAVTETLGVLLLILRNFL
jgi:hypothetical protein